MPASFAESGGPNLDEIATISKGRDITRGYVDSLAVLPSQDAVLSTRGRGELSIYEEVLRDDQVASTFAQRRLAVVSKEWTVEPGGDAKADRMAADFIRETLDRIPWDAITDKMLYGLFYGYALAECLWARDGNAIVLDAVKVRKARRFRFGSDGSLRLLTTDKPDGELMPERKFWHYSIGADNDDEPYGLGLGHWLYWPVFFKRNGIKFWLIFLEKFGQPTAVGKYPKNASEEEKNRLLRSLGAIHTDAGVIVPEGMMIELLEAARSGTVDYTALHDRMNATISKVVVGQTMTTDQGSSMAQADVHLSVRQDLIKADADLICASFCAGPVRWLCEWNFPEAMPPRVWRKIEKAQYLQAQATRDKIIVDMGFKPTLRHIQNTYGGEWVEAPTQTEKPFGQHMQFAETTSTNTEDAPAILTSWLDQAVMGSMDDLTDTIQRIVADATSLEEIRDRLLELYGNMDPDEFGKVMQQALVIASMTGRDEVIRSA